MPFTSIQIKRDKSKKFGNDSYQNFLKYMGYRFETESDVWVKSISPQDIAQAIKLDTEKNVGEFNLSSDGSETTTEEEKKEEEVTPDTWPLKLVEPAGDGSSDPKKEAKPANVKLWATLEDFEKSKRPAQVFIQDMSRRSTVARVFNYAGKNPNGFNKYATEYIIKGKSNVSVHAGRFMSLCWKK